MLLRVSSPKLALNNWSWGKHTPEEPQCRTACKVYPCLWAVLLHAMATVVPIPTPDILLLFLHDTWMLIPPLSSHTSALSFKGLLPSLALPTFQALPHMLLGVHTLHISHHFPSMERCPGRNLMLVSTRHEKVPPWHISATTLAGAAGPPALSNSWREHQQHHTKYHLSGSMGSRKMFSAACAHIWQLGELCFLCNI